MRIKWTAKFMTAALCFYGFIHYHILGALLIFEEATKLNNHHPNNYSYDYKYKYKYKFNAGGLPTRTTSASSNHNHNTNTNNELTLSSYYAGRPKRYAQRLHNQNQNQNQNQTKPYGVMTYLRGDGAKFIAGAIVLLESVKQQNHLMVPPQPPLLPPSPSSASASLSNHNNASSFERQQRKPLPVSVSVSTAIVCHESSVPAHVRKLFQELGHEVVLVKDANIHPLAVPKHPRFKLAIQKYVVLDQIQFEQAIFVDSDALLLKPVTSLFAHLQQQHQHQQQQQQQHQQDTPRIVAMPPDFGRDVYNSGLMIYKPYANMFQDFITFLNGTVDRLPNRKRNNLRRSSQRLFFAFLDHDVNYNASNLCPGIYCDSPRFKDKTGNIVRDNENRGKCNCEKHFIFDFMNCKPLIQQFVLQKAVVIHYVNSAMDIVNWTSPSLLDEVVQYESVRCRLPVTERARKLYFQALSRIGLPATSIDDLLQQLLKKQVFMTSTVDVSKRMAPS